MPLNALCFNVDKAVDLCSCNGNAFRIPDHFSLTNFPCGMLKLRKMPTVLSNNKVKVKAHLTELM